MKVGADSRKRRLVIHGYTNKVNLKEAIPVTRCDMKESTKSSVGGERNMQGRGLGLRGLYTRK